MKELIPIEREGLRVLLSSQLAEAYETTTQIITNNFNRNKERYIEGKHYFVLKGEDKRDFLNRLESQDGSDCHQIDDGLNLNQIDLGLKNAAKLYLWTEKGALLHAKSLNTDKAWEVYDILVETYFHVQQLISQPKQTSSTVEMKQKKAEAKLAKVYLKTIKSVSKLLTKAGVSPEYQVLSMQELLSDLKINVPRIALQHTKTLYDKTTIADKLGVLSSTGKPHALAIGGIITQLYIEKDEAEYTPYYRNGHNGVDVQYTESVIDKVKQWLQNNNYPSQIIITNGNKANVYYR